MSAEYGRSAGGVVNVAYRSGTNEFHGGGWEFFRDTKFNATGYFKPPAGGKPPLERNQFGGVSADRCSETKRSSSPTTKGSGRRARCDTTTIPTSRSAGHPQGRHQQPVRAAVPAGTPDSNDGVRAHGADGLPEPTTSGTANNYVILQEFTNDTDKMGGKVDFQVSPRLSFFGRSGYRDEDIRTAADSAPVRRRRQRITYVTNKQIAFGSTWSPTNGSLVEIRFAWSETMRQEPAGPRIGERRGDVRHYRSADR